MSSGRGRTAGVARGSASWRRRRTVRRGECWTGRGRERETHQAKVHRQDGPFISLEDGAPQLLGVGVERQADDARVDGRLDERHGEPRNGGRGARDEGREAGADAGRQAGRGGHRGRWWEEVGEGRKALEADERVSRKAEVDLAG